MRVEYGFMAEKACKMPDGRTVAYGILGKYTTIAEGQVGHVMPVAIVAEVSFKSPGMKNVEARLTLPDGTSHDLAAFRVDAAVADTAASLVHDGLMLPLAIAGKAKVEMRENGGMWHDVCGVVIVHPASPAPVLPDLQLGGVRH